MISIILYSKSLTHSSALFILLFNAFNWAFISASEFSNFSWLFLYLRIPFWINLHINCPSLIHFIFSLPPFWTWCLLDCRDLFCCILLQGNSPVLLTENDTWASSLCLYFSYFVSLGKTTTVVFKGYIYIHMGSLWGLTFFWQEGCFWFECLLSLSSVCADCNLHAGVWPVCASREMESMGRAINHFLVARPLRVAITCREVAQDSPGCRAHWSGSDTHGGIGGAQSLWE